MRCIFQTLWSWKFPTLSSQYKINTLRQNAIILYRTRSLWRWWGCNFSFVQPCGVNAIVYGTFLKPEFYPQIGEFFVWIGGKALPGPEATNFYRPVSVFALFYVEAPSLSLSIQCFVWHKELIQNKQVLFRVAKIVFSPFLSFWNYSGSDSRFKIIESAIISQNYEIWGSG